MHAQKLICSLKVVMVAYAHSCLTGIQDKYVHTPQYNHAF